MPLAVNEPSAEIAALREQWSLLDALRAGTPAMRAASTAYLPRWPAEETDAYLARLNSATLFPAYRRTVGVMAGKPFAKSLQLADEPASITQWAEDIDLQGVSLHSFAAEMFEEVLGAGLAGILVDYPTVEPAPLGRTKAQVEATGVRPYFVRVKHGQILGWKAGIIGSKVTLTQVRIAETREEDDGPFGVKVVDRVRVLERGRWAVFEQVGKDNAWAVVDDGITTLRDIPFVPLYGRRDGFMLGKPPLLDLAYLNVKHWQSQSDQDTILHVARVPILAMIGADDNTQLTVGGSSAVKLPEGADMKFVEHSGAAIGAGETALSVLEEQMIQTGAELLVKKPGSRTATESQNDAEANKSDLQRIAENFEDALDQALWFMAQYVRLPDAGKVTLFSDYGAASLSDASATLVKDLNMAGIVTKKTVVEEMKRRGVLSPDIDAEREIAEAEAEGPAMGTLGLQDNEDAAASVAG